MPRRRFAGTALGVIGLVIAWLLIAPQQLGGPVSYVVIYGNSMEPGLYAGDLVSIRRSDTYSVGDVVAYNNEDIGQIVLHRVIDIDDGRYTFQGDNNDFVDPAKPTEKELVGRMWFKVSGAGTILKRIQAPVPAAILAGVIGLVVAGGAGAASRRRRRFTADEVPNARSERPGNAPGPRSTTRIVAIVFAIASLVFAALAGFLFLHPNTESATRQIGYTHRAGWSYAADVSTGPVYERDVSTGDPLFLSVVKKVDVRLDYTFETDAAVDLATKGSIDARLSAANGWTRTFEVLGPTEIEGSEGLEGTLDLAVISAAIRDVEKATGVVQQAYQLDLVAPIEVSGTMEGAPLEDRYESSLAFNLDAQQLQLQREPEGPPPAIGEPIVTEDQRAIVAAEEVPARVEVAGLSVPVQQGRLIAVIGFVVCALGALATGIPTLRAQKRDEPSRIQARYGSWLVPARSLDLSPDRPSVEVESIEALARVAERFDLPILYHHSGDEHYYVVEGGPAVYVYTVHGGMTIEDIPLADLDDVDGGSDPRDGEPEPVQ